VRFSPLQTTLSKNLLRELGIAQDFSSAVLIEGDGVYTRSDAILCLFPHMGFPYSWLGPVLLAGVPVFIRDYGYSVFARHRGTIWKAVKRLTGIDDTMLHNYRDRILGLDDNDDDDEPPPAAWGLQQPDKDGSEKKDR
jgi:predicted DCC family thiol-disulfide oxidoreductase YuxK